MNMTVKKFLLKRSHLLRTFNSGGGGWGRTGSCPRAPVGKTDAFAIQKQLLEIVPLWDKY